MASHSGPKRRLVSVACCLLLLSAVVAFGSAAVAGQSPTPTPIDEGSDDTDTEDGRIVPSEQVPFGVRMIYGDDRPTPSGGAGVTVAVVDSGVDADHPDLRDRVTLCRDFTGDQVRNRCSDANGHGTHVAGTVAADGGEDGRGIYGVAPEAEIYAMKACDAEGRCGTDSLAAAIRAAVDEGADIVVLSLGGRSEPRVRAATEYATSRGVVVVAASGNSGPATGTINYPAAHPNVIAVSAVGPRRNERVDPDNYEVPDFSARGVDQSFSNESDATIDIAAPGVSVLSPVPGADYGTKTGTSMAAPHAAGLVAKILSGTSANRSVSALRADLHVRARRYDVTAGQHARAGYDPASGFGVATVSQPEPAFSVAPETPVSTEAFTLDAAPSESDARITEYAWDTTTNGEFDRAGQQIDIDKPPGTHPIALRVTDAENASATVTQDVFVNDRPRLTVRAPESASPGENVTFEAVVANEFGETTVTWTLPDGTNATGGRLTRSFDAGQHTVAATVVDEFGAVTTVIATVVVEEPEPSVIEDQGLSVLPAVLAVLVIYLVSLRRFE